MDGHRRRGLDRRLAGDADFGTIGGNLANASPAAETSGPLLCFEAMVEVRSATGSRRISIADLFSGPGRTTLRPDELIVAVELPELEGAGSCYVRLEFRRQMEIAVVGPPPWCASRTGSFVTPGSPSPPSPRRSGASTLPRLRWWTDGGPAAAAEAGRLAAEAATPISDVRASLDYRRAMAAVVVRRAVTGAIARARGETIPIPASASLFGAR